MRKKNVREVQRWTFFSLDRLNKVAEAPWGRLRALGRDILSPPEKGSRCYIRRRVGDIRNEIHPGLGDVGETTSPILGQHEVEQHGGHIADEGLEARPQRRRWEYAVLAELLRAELSERFKDFEIMRTLQKREKIVRMVCRSRHTTHTRIVAGENGRNR